MSSSRFTHMQPQGDEEEYRALTDAHSDKSHAQCENMAAMVLFIFLYSCQNFFVMLRPGPISRHFSWCSFHLNRSSASGDPVWLSYALIMQSLNFFQVVLGSTSTKQCLSWAKARALDSSNVVWKKKKACSYCHRTKSN